MKKKATAPARRPKKGAAAAPPGRTFVATRWVVLRLLAVYLVFNLGLNLLLNFSQPFRPLRLLTLGRIDERMDAAGLLLRHYLPTHACEANLSQPEIEELATAVARFHGLDPALLMAVVDTESSFVLHAVSPVGAVGLAQLMPSTARWIGVLDPFNPRENLDGAARYLKSLHERFGQDLSLTLAAYNAGPGTVRKYGGIPPWPETEAYVKRVTQRMEHYRGVALAAPLDPPPLTAAPTAPR